MITATDVQIFLTILESVILISFLIGFVRGLIKNKIVSILSACFFIIFLAYILISNKPLDRLYSVNVGAFLGVILGCMLFYFLFIFGKFLGEITRKKIPKLRQRL